MSVVIWKARGAKSVSSEESENNREKIFQNWRTGSFGKIYKIFRWKKMFQGETKGLQKNDLHGDSIGHERIYHGNMMNDQLLGEWQLIMLISRLLISPNLCKYDQTHTSWFHRFLVWRLFIHWNIYLEYIAPSLMKIQKIASRKNNYPWLTILNLNLLLISRSLITN